MSGLTMISRRRFFPEAQKAINWKEADTVLIHIRVFLKHNFLLDFLRQCKASRFGECLMNLRYPFNLQLTYNNVLPVTALTTTTLYPRRCREWSRPLTRITERPQPETPGSLQPSLFMKISRRFPARILINFCFLFAL